MRQTWVPVITAPIPVASEGIKPQARVPGVGHFQGADGDATSAVKTQTLACSSPLLETLTPTIHRAVDSSASFSSYSLEHFFSVSFFI